MTVPHLGALCLLPCECTGSLEIFKNSSPDHLTQPFHSWVCAQENEIRGPPKSLLHEHTRQHIHDEEGGRSQLPGFIQCPLATKRHDLGAEDSGTQKCIPRTAAHPRTVGPSVLTHA